MKNLTHIMTDLETLGTVPGCVGLSIGCVVFDPVTMQLGDEFYTVVNLESSLEHYLRTDPDTEAWWRRQSEEARVVLDHANTPSKSKALPTAMNELNDWFKSVGMASTIRLYGNGADFDNPILRCMYDAAQVKPFPGNWGGRCYRTLKNLHELLGPSFRFHKLERQGTYHNALDDAKSQAVHLMENIAHIRRRTNSAMKGE